MGPMSVLISGAGIAGPALAHELLRAGFTPTIVESAPALRASGYVIDFWGQGYDVMEKMGLLDEVLSTGYQVRELRFVDRRGRPAGGFNADVFRQVTGSRFTTLQRGALNTVLFRSIQDRVNVMFGRTITELEQQLDGVLVHFDGGDSRRFDLVVGADGLHSRVRELTFGPEAAVEHFLGYVAAAFEVEGYRPRDPDVYVTHATPGRQIVRFAMRDDRTMFLLVVADTSVQQHFPRDREAQKAYLRERFSDVQWEWPAIRSALDGCRELYFDRVSQIRMQRWCKGHVALVGDAAYAPSLLAGQGAALAIVGAQVLAGELARASRVEQALDAYQRLLQPFLARKQRAAARFAKSFVPSSRVGILLRQYVTRLFDVPMIARIGMGATLRDVIALPEYATLARGKVASGAERATTTSEGMR